ncbi:MAG: hypothetical protein ABL308_08775 [Oceanicaulis sp.]
MTLHASAAALSLVLAGVADPVSFIEVDADSDGAVTHAELLAVAPDVTEAQYALYDADGNGSYDPPEFDTWLAAYSGRRNDEPGGGEGDDPPR